MSKIILKRPKSFKKYYIDKFKILEDEDYDELLLIGGRSSGKTQAVATYIIFHTIYDKDFRSILFRENQNKIKDTQFEVIRSVSRYLGLEKYLSFTETNGNLRISNVFNPNNYVVARGGKLSVKGINNPSLLWIEEEPFTTQEKYRESVGTLRNKNTRVKTIYTVNPDFDPNPYSSWFYKTYYQDKNGLKEWIDVRSINFEGEKLEYVVKSVHSTYKDNPFVTKQKKSDYELLRKTDENSYKRDTLGEFVPKEIGGQIYHNFSLNRHVVDTYKPLPQKIILSFDFNVNPHNTCTISQYDTSSNEHVFFKEITSIDFSSTFLDMVIRYLKENHFRHLIITGDSTGKTKHAIDSQNYYDKIEDRLKKEGLSSYEVILQNRNTNSIERIEWINDVLKKDTIKIKILRDKCPNLFEDMINQQKTKEGTKNPHKTKVDGVEFERLGHSSDTFDYTLLNIHPTEFEKFMIGTDSYVQVDLPQEIINNINDPYTLLKQKKFIL